MYADAGIILFSVCSLLLGIWAVNRLSPGLDISNEYTDRNVNSEDE